MIHTAPQRLGFAVAGVLISIAAAACSSDSRDGSSNAHALPPNDKAAIERVFARIHPRRVRAVVKVNTAASAGTSSTTPPSYDG